jgi:DNA-binding transcriptional ArsR family regulator
MNMMTLTAIAEPNRFRIVELLRDKPRSVGEIADRLVMRQPQVSKHLKVLNDAGWVEVRPHAQQRIYQLQAKPFTEFDQWLETFKHLWEERFETLDGILEELKEEQSPRRRKPTRGH